MTRDELTNFIQSNFKQAEVEEVGANLTVTIPSNDLLKVIEELRSNESTSLDYLFCQTGVDYPEHMTVVYHLKSTEHGHTLVLKAKIDDRENPKIDTVYHLYKTAEFHEREIYDLFGIVFENHPDLRRILLEDDWEGYPMRKDYVDEINIVEL